VLFSWPLVTFALYVRLPIVRATLWSILGAYLLLPPAIEVDLPLIPPLDKSSISNLSAFFSCWFIAGKPVRLLPNILWARLILLAFVSSPFITALLNPEPIIAGQRFIKGMEYYDAFSSVIRQIILMLPFAMGFALFRSEQDLESIFRVLALSGILYSVPMLLEVRLSPQLNQWIYGYFPSQFLQSMRGEGFRPVVFIGHGLGVAYFAMTALISAAALQKLRLSVLGISSTMTVMFLIVVLFLCKSLGSVVYAIVILFLMYSTKPINQVKIAQFLVLLTILYPLLWTADLVPLQNMVDMAEVVSEERATSLNFRFENEERLLNKAMQHPFFGWGSWGRNRVYDLVTGKDLSVTDGRWIITLGSFGLMGFLAEFGLLALPVFLCARNIKRTTNRRELVMVATLAMLLTINMIDLLPNSTLTPFSWLLAGSLLGYSRRLKTVRK